MCVCCAPGLLEADIDTAPPADQAIEKVKKRYRKKKTKLEEAFPSYLQVTHTHSMDNGSILVQVLDVV